MANQVIRVEEATRAQLHKYLTTVAGLPLGPMRTNVKTEDLIAQLRATGYTHDAITLSVDDDLVPDALRARPPKEDEGVRIPKYDPERKVRIRLLETSGIGGNEPVPVRVNGVAISIPRAKWCDVKEKYVKALQLAVLEDVTQDREGNLLRREVPQFPFEVDPKTPLGTIYRPGQELAVEAAL